MKGMRKCATPGCNARVLTRDKCEHCRPRNNRKRSVDPAEKERRNALERQRSAKRRAALGLMPGWEGAAG